MGSHRARGYESRASNASIDRLHLAATPIFVLMALLTATSGAGTMGMLCPAAHAMSPLDGMTVMYLLMAVFHAAPWLKRTARWRRDARHVRTRGVDRLRQSASAIRAAEEGKDRGAS